jgi:hypothetical protein
MSSAKKYVSAKLPGKYYAWRILSTAMLQQKYPSDHASVIPLLFVGELLFIINDILFKIKILIN